MSTAVATTASQTAEPTLKQRFGSGRYFSVQCEAFRDIQRLFLVSSDHAEKYAKALATKLGVVFSGQVEIGGYSNLNKNKEIKSLWEFAKVKNLPLCNEIAVLRAIAYCNQAGANHVSMVAKLDADLLDWIAKL